jgi:hypothetical protein
MKKSFHSGGIRASVSSRVIGAVRPAVEAAMLAAVAFGFAQAGWSLVAPPAGAVDSVAPNEGWRSAASQSSDAAVARVSPFAPDAGQGAGASGAASAFVSTLQLVSVRVSEDADRSGAIIAMQDGSERAFLVGQELSTGVVLADVRPGGVEIAFAGVRRDLQLAAPEGHSFAAALLGRIEAPAEMAFALSGAAQPELASPQNAAQAQGSETPFAVIADGPREAIVEVTPNASFATPPGATLGVARVNAPAADLEPLAAYFAPLIASTPQGRIPETGVALPGPLPLEVAAAGLKAGDVVLAINGATQIDLAALAAMRGAGAVEFTVRRNSSAPMQVRASLRSPT